MSADGGSGVLRRTRPVFLLLPALLTLMLVFALLSLIASRAFEDPSTPGPEVAFLALIASVVLATALLLPLAFRRVSVRVTRWWPWIVGLASAGMALLGWWLVMLAPALGAAWYRAGRVPQGIVQFWDLRLTLETVDCASWGFDVFQANNGCLVDPSIYGPGITWLGFLSSVFTESNTEILGLGIVLLSSVALIWIARHSKGVAAAVLIAAAVGAPWQLLLERGNFDALVIVGAVGVVAITRRWNTYWAWVLSAALIWTLGTWKYYPFVLGVLLLPALRLRRGWVIVVGFVAATGAFFVLLWRNVLLSLAASSEMAELGDFVVLGRVPVVARLPEQWAFGHWLFAAICLAAVWWGVSLGRSLRGNSSTPTSIGLVLLALAGSLLYLSSVAVTGFAYGYKAAFLILLIPMVRWSPRLSRAMLWTLLALLSLSVIAFLVVWNTVLATTAGTLVACVVAGWSAYVIVSERWAWLPGRNLRYQRESVSIRA